MDRNVTTTRILEIKPDDYSRKVKSDIKNALELFSKSDEINIKDLIKTIRYAKEQKLHLDLTERNERGHNIITLAAYANEVEFLASLLKSPEFHPNVFKFDFWDLKNAGSCEVVEAFLKNLEPEVLQKIPNFKLLRMNDCWYFMTNFYNKKEKTEEPECKELTTFRGYKEAELKDGYTNPIILTMLYQRGANEINNNKNLLKNYNKVVQTYGGGKYEEQLTNGHLKALYIMRVALDKMSASEVWNIYSNYKFDGCAERAFAFPNKTSFPSHYAGKLVVLLYILNNQDKFSFLKKEDFEKIQHESDLSRRDLRFTGHIPHYGFISKANWPEVINSVMASHPKKDLFNLLKEGDKEEKISIENPVIRSSQKIINEKLVEKREEKKLEKPTSDKYARFMQDYINKMQDQKPTLADMLKELKYLNCEEKMTLKEFLDPVHKTVITLPARFVGHLFNLDTLEVLADQGKKDPIYNEFPVEKNQIQPDHEAAKQIELALKAIKAERDKIKQATPLGALSFRYHGGLASMI